LFTSTKFSIIWVFHHFEQKLAKYFLYHFSLFQYLLNFGKYFEINVQRSISQYRNNVAIGDEEKSLTLTSERQRRNPPGGKPKGG